MTKPAAPDFMSDMMNGLDALDSGEVPDGPPTPVVDDNPDTSGEHGEVDAGAAGDTAGEGDAGADGGDSGAAESGDVAKDGADGKAGKAAQGDAGNAPSAGREQDPVTGRFKKSTAPVPAKPDAAAAAKPAVKAVDPINDPIPAGLKPATAERMTKLVETAKTLTAERNEAQKGLDDLIQSVATTGMNGQEFGDFLNVVGDARSEDPARVERAFTFFTTVVADMAKQLGKTVPGTDALEGHDDLRARVNAGTLYRGDAEQIASARRAQAANEQRVQRQQQNNQAAQEQTVAQQRERQAGRAAMIELETTLAAADPNFAAKKAILASDANFIATLKATPPSQWVTAFNKKYRETKIAAAAPKLVAKTIPGNTPQPLRGRAPAGSGQVQAAKTLQDAMAAADFSKA